MEKNKNSESELPENYELSFYINAANAKFGLLFNLIAVFIYALVALIAFIPIFKNDAFDALKDTLFGLGAFSPLIYALVFVFTMAAYIFLHELTHGVSYRLFTKEKLSFGMKWSCFYCGVPNIYVYRKAVIISAAAPLIIFSILFVPLTICLYHINLVLYFASAFILGIHIGGCSGDIYVILLLLFKFKNSSTLVRDTGPEQFFYTANDA